MSDQQQTTGSMRSLSAILWLYIGIMLWTLLSTEIPIAPAHDVMYELSGLILALLPVILVVPAKGNDRIGQLKSLLSTLDLWIKGFLLVLICVVLMSAYSLMLRFVLPGDASSSIGAAFFNWVIVLLKWSGIGLIFWSQLDALRQKISAADTDAAKRKSRILYGLVSVLLFVLIAFLARHDLSAMLGFGLSLLDELIRRSSSEPF